MKTLKERFELALERAKTADPSKSMAGLARFCKVSKPAVSKWFQGGSIDGDNASRAAEYLGVSTDWLLREKGPMDALRRNTLVDPDQTSGQTGHIQGPRAGIALDSFSLWDDDTPLEEDEVALPLFKEVEMAAGSGTQHSVEINGRKLRFSKATLRAAGVDPANAACATVTGNSMERLILGGATVGIDRGRTQIADGEIYAIDHDGMLRVKYVYRLPGGGMRLRSENREEHPDEVLSGEEAQKVRILGWVFWWSTVRKWRGK
jgi:phage repressor protein C with HTH and peptisase S24 domain